MGLLTALRRCASNCTAAYEIVQRDRNYAQIRLLINTAKYHLAMAETQLDEMVKENKNT
jgi:hypothetical protein